MVKVVSEITVFRLIRVVMMVKVVTSFRESGWSEWSRWSTSPQGKMVVLAFALAEKGPHILPPLPGEARV